MQMKQCQALLEWPRGHAEERATSSVATNPGGCFPQTEDDLKSPHDVGAEDDGVE